jgi:uncharacterized protein (TIGR02246 family)
MSDQTSELHGLDRAREIHVAALNAGDADGWAECFDFDAVQMPPNQPSNVGAERIREWTRGFLAMFRAEFSLAPDDVELAGTDLAFERGRYEIRLTPAAGGEALRDSGKYLTVYRRRAGSRWLMAQDIWNSDKPPMG